MKLIVGLGNPGEKYENTRHNVGFMVVDFLSSKITNSRWLMTKKFNSFIINNQSSAILCKPQTFMNSSGEAVSKLINFYKIYLPNLWIIHDDLDIKLGQYKVQFGVGPKVHNGVNSIEEKLGKKDFWRVRIGVDNRVEEKDKRVKGEEYVLQNFTREERKIVNEVIEKVASDLSGKKK